MYKAVTIKETQINRLKAEIETADAIIIGAGAGLSASAGFTYTGSRFGQYFIAFWQMSGMNFQIHSRTALIYRDARHLSE